MLLTVFYLGVASLVMTLHHIDDMSRELMGMMNAASWHAMTPEERREALVRAADVEGNIRELVNRHNAALHKVVRKHHHVPAGHAVHDADVGPREAFTERMEEIEIRTPEAYVNMQPDDASHGLPENVACVYNFARSIHEQAAFLAFGADARHEANRHELEADVTHIVGHA